MIRYAQDGVNLRIFDESGQLVTKHEYVKSFEIKEVEGKNYLELLITDTVINLNFWEHAKTVKDKYYGNDSYNEVGNEKAKTVLSHTKEPMQRYKIVADTIIYDQQTARISEDVTIKVPNVVLVDDGGVNFTAGKSFTPTYKFRVYYCDEEETYYDTVIKER